MGLYQKVMALIAPTKLGRAIVEWQNYSYDAKRYVRHSSTHDNLADPMTRKARLTKAYHSIEKGMALPDPRPGYGDWALHEIRTHLPGLEAEGQSGLETQGARATVAQYAAWHGDKLPEDVAWTADYSPAPVDHPGGTTTLTPEDLKAAQAMDFDRFARSRYSIRQYTGAPVSPDEIERAIATALKSPRVCNRESRRVHVAYSEEARTRLLAHQNGNRGFGHKAGAVLVITSDVRHFTDLSERNQGWIDGGLFAMSLAYALHGQGLGACMLNWSAIWWRDRNLRREFNIPDHEIIITMMAVGQIPADGVTVATSPAPDVAAVLSEIK